MWAPPLQLILLTLCTASVRGKEEEPDNLLEEEGYLLASNLAIHQLPTEQGSGGGSLEGSAEGSGVELEPEEEERSYPRLRNITIFPACISDYDCKGEGYKCFQYMCYPWKQVSGNHV